MDNDDKDAHKDAQLATASRTARAVYPRVGHPEARARGSAHDEHPIGVDAIAPTITTKQLPPPHLIEATSGTLSTHMHRGRFRTYTNRVCHVGGDTV